MNSWSRTRKRIILGIIFLFVIVLVGVPFFFLFYRAPTCSDFKMNGDETGVDCGGSCQLLCQSQSLPLILKGDARVLTLASSTYQVVALVENVNQDAEIYKAGYRLKLYDAQSLIPLQTIEGETYIPPGQTIALFEGPLSLSSGLVPTRATLEWREETLAWKKIATSATKLLVKETSLSTKGTSPRLTATVENQSLDPVSNIDLVALLSDSQGNLFAASKTYVENLLPGDVTQVVFTWPRPFGGEAASTQIIVRVFPDRSFLR